jgi:hypothetical protein
MKRPIFTYLAIVLLIILGGVINFIVMYANNMAAGLFAPQDIMIFKIFVNKPYTKIHAVGFGILLAYIFNDIN